MVVGEIKRYYLPKTNSVELHCSQFAQDSKSDDPNHSKTKRHRRKFIQSVRPITTRNGSELGFYNPEIEENH